MKPNRLLAALIGTVLMANAGNLLAQTDSGEPYYVVEVAILTSPTIDQALNTDAADVSLGYPGTTRTLTTAPAQLAADDSATLSESDGEDSTGLTPAYWQQADNTELDNALRKLRRQGYRPLWHKQWQQPVNGRATTPAVLIAGGRIYENHSELEGSVSVFKQNYPHLAIDVWFSRFEQSQTGTATIYLPTPPVTEEESQNSFGADNDTFDLASVNTSDSQLDLGFGNFKRSLYQAVAIDTLQQSRRVNLNQVIYYDGPGLIALAKITQVKP